jgi:hypothetical protein
VLVNAAMEGVRRLRLSNLLLRRRARRMSERRPLVIVPPCFGTRLLDDRGRHLWGSTRRLFFGTSFAVAGPGHIDGMMARFPVVPGVYGYDVFEGFVSFLEQVGGYTRNEDLFIFLYDWRLGVPEAAAELDALVDRIRGFSDDTVDMISVSSGGLVARYYLAHATDTVARSIYMGVPQRGTFSAFAYLQDGFEFLRGGKHFEARELHHCRGLWYGLPHPAERIFVDPGGEPLEHDLYDPDTWGRLGLEGAHFRDLRRNLEATAELHRTLDAAPPHRDSFAIAGHHIPTPTRAIVEDGRVLIPCQYCPEEVDESVGFGPGDGALPEHTLKAVPGMQPGRMWWVRPSAHYRIASDPAVHPIALEALLASRRPIRSDLYPCATSA